MYSDWWKIEWVKEMFFLLLYYDIDQNWILALQQFRDTHNKLILPKMISDYFMEATIHKINDHSCRSEEKFDLPFGTELVDLMSIFNGLWNRDFWWICLNNCFFNFNNNSENSFDVHPQKMSHSIMNIHLFKEVILSSINWTSKSPYTKQKLPQCIKIYPAIFPNIFVPSYHNLSTEHDSISANFTPLPTTSPLLDFFFFSGPGTERSDGLLPWVGLDPVRRISVSWRTWRFDRERVVHFGHSTAWRNQRCYSCGGAGQSSGRCVYLGFKGTRSESTSYRLVYEGVTDV